MCYPDEIFIRREASCGILVYLIIILHYLRGKVPPARGKLRNTCPFNLLTCGNASPFYLLLMLCEERHLNLAELII